MVEESGTRGMGYPQSGLEQSIVSGVSEFPEDLIEAQRRLHKARHELSVHYRSLPTWAEASQLPEAADWTPDQPPIGMTREQYAYQEQLLARVSELAAFVHGHAFWNTLTGPQLVQARSALKRAEGAVPECGVP